MATTQKTKQPDDLRRVWDGTKWVELPKEAAGQLMRRVGASMVPAAAPPPASGSRRP